MSKVHIKIVNIFLIIVLFSQLLLMPVSVYADGMIISRPDPYSNRWDYVEENSQQAFINYSGGIERLIVAIQYTSDNAASGSVWLLPVPAEAQKVVVDVVTELPKFSGEDVDKLAKSRLAGIRNTLLATQLYPIPYIITTSFFGASRMNYGMDIGIPSPAIIKISGNDIYNREQDVQVVEHLEKEGLISEVITAKTAQGLYDYFQSKNLDIQEGNIPVLDEYTGRDFSFVAVWRGQTVETGQRAVFITFPAKKIFFPLLPTSVYGSKTIPATIRITGHVSPKISQDIQPYTRVKYYVNNNPDNSGLKSFWWNTENKNYTKIEISAPSKLLTSDLYISNFSPFSALSRVMIGQHPNISAILLLIVISIISSLIWSLVLFPQTRNFQGMKIFALLGLTNIFSFLAVIVATFFIKTKNISPDSATVKALKQKGYITRRRWAIVCLLAAPFTYLIMQLVVTILGLFISSFGGLWGLSFSGGYRPQTLFSFLYLFLIPLSALLYLMPLILIIVATIILIRKLLKVKPEDQILFEYLKKQNINSWTLVPKDIKKVAFVPLFSLTFVFLTFSSLSLIENSQAQEGMFQEDVTWQRRQSYDFRPTPTRTSLYYPTRTPTPPPFPTIATALQNSSFEKWDNAVPDNWTLVPGSQLNKPTFNVFDGANAVEIPTDRSQTYLTSDSVKIQGNVTLQPRIWYKTDSDCLDCAFFGFQFFDQVGSEIISGVENCGDYNRQGKMWYKYIQGKATQATEFKAECTIPANAVSYKFKFGIWNTSESIWQFDNIKIRPKPWDIIPNQISATSPCPTELKDGLCILPNCSYTYPNDIYTPGHLIVGTKYKPEAKTEGYWYDECTSDNKHVKEMICSKTSEGDYTESGAIYECPMGCQRGRCIE